MDNQHRKISGYRELTQAEIDLMNEIKAFGPQLQALCEKIESHINHQLSIAWGSVPSDVVDADELTSRYRDKDEQARLDSADPYNWYQRGERALQEGLMFLTRSVAQPTFF